MNLPDRAPLLPHIAGPYPITAVCGIVDAACFLSLGHVFAAIMTGNLAFLCFQIGGGGAILHHPNPVAIGGFSPVRRRAGRSCDAAITVRGSASPWNGCCRSRHWG